MDNMRKRRPNGRKALFEADQTLTQDQNKPVQSPNNVRSTDTENSLFVLSTDSCFLPSALFIAAVCCVLFTPADCSSL